MTRLAELAEQAANGTLGGRQRRALDEEAQSLSREYTRIAQSTAYNGRSLFNGTYGSLRLQAGYGTDGGIQSTLGGAIGTGTFGARISSDVTGTPVDLQTGDLNGDGALDVVQFTGTTASVQIGNGDGTFRFVSSYFMDGLVSAGLLADVNNDGVLDIVTGGQNSGLTTASISFRYGLGNGTFGAALSVLGSASYNPGLAVGDVNGDGVTDLIGANAASTTVHLGNGNGTYRIGQSFAGITATSAATLQDVNNDGLLDLITSGWTGNGQFSVRLGSASGAFGSATTYGSADTQGYFGVQFGDLNGDGITDIVASSYGLGNESMVNIHLGNGNGTFRSSPTLTVGVFGEADVNVGDINGDGLLDFIAQTGGNPTTFLGNGNGTFSASASVNGAFSQARFADMNGDGVLDVVSAGVNVNLGNTQSGAAPIVSFSLRTVADARQALPVFQRKIAQIAAQRAHVGVFQSRVSSATSNLGTIVESVATAESRIRDVDLAEESSNLVRLNILQQSAAGILAQANVQPELALRLLNAT